MNKPMNLRSLDLSPLSFEQLEDLWIEHSLSCDYSDDYDFPDRLIAEMISRPDACPQDYDLILEMQNEGWQSHN